jgi:serine protease Do
MNDPILEELEKYLAGTLSQDEREALEHRMQTDDTFREQATSHLQFLRTLDAYKNQESLRSMLDTFHSQIAISSNTHRRPVKRFEIKKYWPTIAVAASVALISILGTLWTTESIKQKHAAEYKVLRRNVEQIKKSQEALIADIAEAKEKEIVLARYAGTGFMISQNGYCITSAHVVRDADSVFVENKTFGRLKAEVIKTDPDNDVAILRIDTTRISLPYTISKREADLGENVFTLGFPKEDIVYGEGAVSAASGYKQNSASYQITVPVNPGNSGGPLLNSRGDIVGMISGLQTETYAAAFAIKSSVLLNYLDTVAVDSLQPIRLPSQNRLKNLTRVEQIKKLQDFIFVVRVYNQR